MQLVSYNMSAVSHLHVLQSSPRQCYKRELAHFTLHFDFLLHSQLNFDIL